MMIGRAAVLFALLAPVSCSSSGDVERVGGSKSMIATTVAVVLSESACSGVIEAVERLDSDPRGHIAIDVEGCEGHTPIYAMLASSDHPDIAIESSGREGTVFIRRVVQEGSSWSQAIRIPGDGWIHGQALSERNLRSISQRARRIGERFLSDTPSCAKAFNFDIAEIDGRNQQRIIDRLFSVGRLSRQQIRCLIAQLGSRGSLETGSFAPPFWSRERVYHHSFSERRQLVLYLLPWLTEFNLEFYNCDDDESCYRRYATAWAFWAASEYKDS